jgi:hypothetical protein
MCDILNVALDISHRGDSKRNRTGGTKEVADCIV